MRIKSSIIKLDFSCFDTDVRKDEIDNFFIDFDVILSVAIKKCEHFDDFDSNINAKQNIDFDVAKRNKRNKRTIDC